MKIHDPIISEVMTEIATDYYPGQRWLTTTEPVTVAIVEHRSAHGIQAVYRRDSTNIGSLEASIRLWDVFGGR